jgi:hypothetical protein
VCGIADISVQQIGVWNVGFDRKRTEHRNFVFILGDNFFILDDIGIVLTDLFSFVATCTAQLLFHKQSFGLYLFLSILRTV